MLAETMNSLVAVLFDALGNSIMGELSFFSDRLFRS